MKLIILGPVYPYKGGISQYTGMMCHHLKDIAEVITLSYSKQYPSVLYKKEQKDFVNDSCKVDNVKYIFSTINPITWVQSAFFCNKEKSDMIIIQWWHPFFAIPYGIFCRFLNRKSKVIYLCHNVFPHDSFPMSRFLTKFALRKGDGFILHSELDVENLKRAISNPIYKRTAIPTFDAFNKFEAEFTEARMKLGLHFEDNVLLFFGFIREYKGLKFLIRALPFIMKQKPNTVLLIVGDFFENNKDEYLNLIKETGCEKNIHLFDGYITDQEICVYFTASDLIVLPYVSATQSAVVQTAYSFSKPVIVTDVGGLPEAVEDGVTGYVVPTRDEEKLAEGVLKYFSEKDNIDFKANIKNEAYKFSWDRMNEVVVYMAMELSK